MKKVKEKILQALYYIMERPILTAFSVLVISTAMVMLLSWKYYGDAYGAQILVEAHGMLFDIAIIGILLYWLNQKGEIRQRIRSYLNEIDDFRLWHSEEAAFRTVGNIRRLNKENIHDINLANFRLQNTNISYVNLTGANLNSANISNCTLVEINLAGARMNQTNFENSNLNGANLKGAYASGSNFQDAYLIKTDLENAFLIKVNFKNAYLMEANLSNSYLMGADLENANLYKANLRGAKGLTGEQLSKAKSLYLAEMDPELQDELRAIAPNLVEG